MTGKGEEMKRTIINDMKRRREKSNMKVKIPVRGEEEEEEKEGWMEKRKAGRRF